MVVEAARVVEVVVNVEVSMVAPPVVVIVIGTFLRRPYQYSSVLPITRGKEMPADATASSWLASLIH